VNTDVSFTKVGDKEKSISKPKRKMASGGFGGNVNFVPHFTAFVQVSFFSLERFQA
jgi:hypothetical protein